MVAFAESGLGRRENAVAGCAQPIGNGIEEPPTAP